MPSPFDITVATNTVTLDNNRQGVAAFTVKNNTRRHVHATARVSTQPSDGAKWLTILPPPGGGTNTASGRDFDIDSTQQYQVQIAVPMDAAPASYTLKLTVADDVNPDDNFTDSPDVVFTVRELPKPQPRPFPMWIIPAVVIVLIVIVAIIVVVTVNANNTANANATGTAVALANARDIADTATANAILNVTATANAVGTQNALATQVAQATQTALNVFIGNWIPADSSNSGTVGSMNITSAGGNLFNITFTSNCSPVGNLCNVTAATYQINGVPYNPNQIAATLQNETFIIQPANGGQLVVTVSVGPFTNAVTMKRSPNRFQIIGELTNFQFQQASQFQMSQIQPFLATPSK